jgi:hypothetical protein
MASKEEMLIGLEKRIEALEIAAGTVPDLAHCICSKPEKISEAIQAKLIARKP